MGSTEGWGAWLGSEKVFFEENKLGTNGLDHPYCVYFLPLFYFLQFSCLTKISIIKLVYGVIRGSTEEKKRFL